jgi:membrane protein
MLKRIEKILTSPTESLGRASRLLVWQVKLWLYCARHLKENKAQQQAAALAYKTIFGIVPLAIVTVMIFHWFSADQVVGKGVKGFIYGQLNLETIRIPADVSARVGDPNVVSASADSNTSGPTILLTDYLDQIVGGFFTGMDTGKITLFGAVLVIWAAVTLLNTVERAFNDIWHVDRPRPFLNRVVNHWAILTLGPLLLGLGIYLAMQTAAQYAQSQLVGEIHRTMGAALSRWIFSYGVGVVAFFLLYLLLPHTKVRIGPALWGAAVAALAWSLVKWGFGLYVTKLIPYSKIYGVLGLMPLAVLWIYLTWLIVLFGAHVAYTTQHLHHLEAAALAVSQRHQDRFIASDVTVLQIVREVGMSFESGEGPVPAEQLFQTLGLSPQFGQKLLTYLVETGLLMKVSEPTIGYTLARAPEQIRLVDISLAVAKASFSNASPEEILDSHRLLQTKQNLKDLLGEG